MFGFHMPSFNLPGAQPENLFDHLTDLARAAEAAGFDFVTVMDHFYQIPGVGQETDPMLEGYSTLAALAAQTSRVKLGTLVTGVTYRNPALLAKTVTTLDVISKGRAFLGIGAAWNESEHRGYGFEFPPIGERMNRLEEAIVINRLMFTQERPSFEGRYYKIESAFNQPRPLQPGGPRILVGGSGEQRTLRIAARYADITHWFGTPELFRRKNEVLARHCEAEGRDPSTILRTAGVPLVLARDEAEQKALFDSLSPDRQQLAVVGTPEQAAEKLQAYFEAGIHGLTFNNPTLITPERVALAGELIRLLRPGATSGTWPEANQRVPS